MAYKSLEEFVSLLEKEGELKRITVPADPELEITEIADRVMKNSGPALLFEKVNGSDFPLLINAFGSKKRMALALGVSDIEEIADEIRSIVETEIPSGLIDKIKTASRAVKLASYTPEIVKDGPCKEVIIKENPSFDLLPVMKCWPDDGGKYITLPQVFTKSLKDGKRNVGMYRMQLFDEKTSGMHWQIHHDGARHFQEHKEAGKRMEVAVALGGDPALTYAATAPLPPNLDEILFAGFLRKKKVQLVKGETIDIEVPANADIVLEGYVEVDELRREGPFGDHTGFYSLADDYQVFHLTCITHRKNPVYPSTIVGKPPMEDAYMGKATERIFLPLLQTQIPEIVDMNLPVEGVFHNLAIISIDKRYPFHARKVMHNIWGMGQMMLTKTIIILDKDVDVHNLNDVMWKVTSSIDPKRDITFTEGPVDVLDHASALPCIGSKIGIDATRKWKEEGFDREWPDEITMSKDIVDLVNRRWKEYGFSPEEE
jgi:4-hydroxy-3-polyprenylbenzoate decarboxylase